MPHKWTQITDLPPDAGQWASPELGAIAGIWKEQSARLRQLNSVAVFTQRLSREWAIETGVIENVYQIDKGVTIALIEKGIEASLIPHGASDRPAEEIVRIVRDHQAALDGLFAFVKQQRPLSKSYIRELHAQMMAHQASTIGQNTLGQLVEIELIKGGFKRLPNNPSILGVGLHEYCPPEHVESEMDNLMSWHREHLARGLSIEVEAAWLHHRFTQIHPFQDGNGRVARAIASLVFIREGYFPLLITRETRADYIEALGRADNDDLLPLISLFARSQKDSLLKALSLSEDVLGGTPDVDRVIEASIARLRERHGQVSPVLDNAFVHARRLEADARAKCEETAQLLTGQLCEIDPKYEAAAEGSDPNNDSWFRNPTVSLARQRNYYADTTTYRAWVRLTILDERQSSIAFAFHSVGPRFVGILGITAFIEFRERGQTPLESGDGPHPISDAMFEFSHLDDLSVLRERFGKWLDAALAVGLDQWRRQL